MRVKQISLFLENKTGRLSEVTQLLGQEQINIRALSIADTTDFGILRLIVSDPDRAYSALKAKDFAVSMTDVLAVEVGDHPGGLGEILRILGEAGANIEYLYAFLEKSSQDALVVFRVEQLDEAVSALQAAGVSLLSGEKVYSL